MSPLSTLVNVDAQGHVADAVTLTSAGVQGQPGAPGQPGGSARVGPVIEAQGPSASVSVLGDLNSDGMAVVADGGAPVKLILQHPPLGFIGSEIDVDVTPATALSPSEPLSSDQVWIELAGVAFDRVAFVPQSPAASVPATPVVGSVVLLQGNQSVYTLNDVHAAHYGGPGGGSFSVGVDARTGYHYVAYGPSPAS